LTMRRLTRSALIAFSCWAMVGCAGYRTALSPAQAVAELQTGQSLLSCRQACVAAWREAEPLAAQLDRAAQWANLAALVENVGYQDDLSLYYLGRAAEGLGYSGAAASYFRQSAYLSGTSISCVNLSRACGGVRFPRAALLRLTAIDRALEQAPHRPTRRATPRPHAIENAAPAAGSPATSAADTALRPQPVGAGPPTTAGPDTGEYIEPPPAAR
jgi:hypothetical protein